MATIKFYRVETETGEGPYRGDDIRRVQDTHRVDWYQHPGPRADARLHPQWLKLTEGLWFFEPEGWLFGFTSKRALKAWFYGPEARADLGSRGYRVTVYSVPERHIRRGTKQAVMYRPEATLVDRLALSHV